MEDKELLNMALDEPNFYDLSNISKAYIVTTLHKIIFARGLDVPIWIYDKKFMLKEPEFFLKSNGIMRLYLLFESPVEFKMRNLFVSENALERC